MAQKEMSGTISKNNRKEKDSHPDIRGSATIKGVEYWISGWMKTGQDGSFYSLSFQEKQPRNQSSYTPPSQVDDNPW